jgi:hypothetical protein
MDPNDKEIVESLRYLQISPEEKLKIQSKPFDAKKNCWIEDHKDGYIQAEIISTDERKKESSVKTSKGEVCNFIII